MAYFKPNITPAELFVVLAIGGNFNQSQLDKFRRHQRISENNSQKLYETFGASGVLPTPQGLGR